MKLRLLFFWLVCLPFFTLQAEFTPTEIHEAFVSHIIDGDTFVTSQGEHVRMLGINTPEKAKGKLPAEPFANQSTQRLKELIEHQNVILTFGKKKQDKFKRSLAYVYLAKNKTWINEAMIKDGFAHVYSFPDTANDLTLDLLKAENQARAEHKGLWALPRWKTLDANATSFPNETIGHFYIAEGVITHTAEVKGRLFLNFGEDWRTDFTAEVPPQYRSLFKESSQYMGQKVRVRGVLKPINGVMITMTHPEQLEFLD